MSQRLRHGGAPIFGAAKPKWRQPSITCSGEQFVVRPSKR
jgi:hypothetical protein